MSNSISPVLAIELSSNKKIGKCSTTYSSFNSCPNTCPWYQSRTCYAMSGPAGIWANKITKSEVVSPDDIAQYEANAIDSLSGKHNLRIHTNGDCTTDIAAKLVSEAAERFMAKSGKVAWTYTHSFSVKRKSWGKVSVLRSCENITQVKQSFEEGYAAAMVVSEFKDTVPYVLEDDIIGIPCLEQIGQKNSCVDCTLCFKDELLLRKKRVILFAPHGSKKKHMLPILNS